MSVHHAKNHSIGVTLPIKRVAAPSQKIMNQSPLIAVVQTVLLWLSIDQSINTWQS